MDYKNAGVDIEAGYKSVELMKKHILESDDRPCLVRDFDAHGLAPRDGRKDPYPDATEVIRKLVLTACNPGYRNTFSELELVHRDSRALRYRIERDVHMELSECFYDTIALLAGEIIDLA